MPAAPPTFDDPVLARLAATVPVPPVDATGDVFHDLVSCLAEQQIHYRSTKGTFKRALDRAGLDRVAPATLDRFVAEGLAGVRLSGQKQRALAAAATAFRGDGVPDWPTATGAEARRWLAAIPGVGPWTVDMVLLYTLGRPDVFPAGDYHLKQAMAVLYDLPEAGLARAMREVAEGWRPHRSLGTRTLLAWREMQRELAR